MAVSTFSKAAASGGAAGPVSVVPLSSTSGVFNVDLSAGNAFSLDFTESYFDQEVVIREDTPEFVGSHAVANSNGSILDLYGNSLSGGSATTYSDGDLLIVAVTGGVYGTNATSAPSITYGAGFNWKELVPPTIEYATNSLYGFTYAIWYAFADGNQDPATQAIRVRPADHSYSGNSAVLSVIRNVVDSSQLTIESTSEQDVSTALNYLDTPALTVSAGAIDAKILYFVHSGRSSNINPTLNTAPLTFEAWTAVTGSDTTDATTVFAISDSAYQAGDTVAAQTQAWDANDSFSIKSFAVSVKSKIYQIGIGRDATLNITGYNNGVEDKSFYYKNTNSSGQKYNVLGGTGFTSATLFTAETSTTYSAKLISFLDGSEIPASGGAAPPKARKYARITSSGTYDLPADVSGLKIIAVGGGGGGGYYQSSYGGGGGGGGGQYLEYQCPIGTAAAGVVAAGATLNITIGAGGAGGTVSQRFAGFGGNTTVEADGFTVCTAYGGQGGNAGWSLSQGDYAHTDKWGSGGGDYYSSSSGAGGGGGAGGSPVGGTSSIGAGATASWPGRFGHAAGAQNTYNSNGGPGINGMAGGGGGGAGANSSQFSSGYGVDGGGDASHSYAGYAPTPGLENTGGGGGGGNSSSTPSANGGSGIVLLEYWTAE